MKKIALLLLLIVSYSYIYPQVVGGSQDKLAKLYNQGKYESCLFKADNLTYKDDYKRDPEPYLYIAMCFYQLSQSEDEMVREDYKDGVKQAIRYAARFVKYDKKGEMYADNIDFINKLKDEQIKKIKQEMNDNNYRKAATAAKYYNRLNTQEDFAVSYFIGMCQILSNNLSQGAQSIEKATEKLNEQLDTKTFKADNKIKSLLIDGFLKYSEYLVSVDRKADAAGNLTFGLKLFPNNGYIKVQYNLINKSLNDNNSANEQ